MLCNGLILGVRLVPEPGDLHDVERPHEAQHRLRRAPGCTQARAEEGPPLAGRRAQAERHQVHVRHLAEGAEGQQAGAAAARANGAAAAAAARGVGGRSVRDQVRLKKCSIGGI